MLAGITAILNAILAGRGGVTPLQTTLDTDLTPTRAGYLDLLPYLTGPAALQADLGLPTDAESGQGALFPLMQACELLLCDIEAKTKQIANATATQLFVTANTVAEVQAQQQQPATSIARGVPPACPPWPNLGLGILPTTFTLAPTSAAYPAQLAGGTAGTVVTLGGQTGAPVPTVTKLFAPGDGATQLFASAAAGTLPVLPSPGGSLAPLSALQLPGVTLPALGGCSGTAAVGVLVTLNGYVPPATVATFYPFLLGAAGTPCLGLQWDQSRQAFTFVAQNASGVVSVVPVAESNPFPLQILWSANGATLSTAANTSYTLAATYCPPTTTPLPALLPQGNSYLTYVAPQYL